MVSSGAGVERHLAGYAACGNEERRLRESHERLASVSIAASFKPADLKARILGAMSQRGGGREATFAGTARDSRDLLPLMRWAVAAAMLLLLLPAGLVVAYSKGVFEHPNTMDTLAPTEIAPGRGVRGKGFGL